MLGEKDAIFKQVNREGCLGDRDGPREGRDEAPNHQGQCSLTE